MTITRIFGAALLLSGLALIHAQTEEPRILRIVREDVKSGKGAEHQKIEAAYARAFAKAGFANYIGMESVTGPNQAWFVEAFDSWASIEYALKLQGTEPLRSEISPLGPQDGELLTADSSMVASLQKGLSYLPGALNLASMRYVNVYAIRIRPGHAPDFAERAKLLNAAREKTGWKGRAAVYRIESGAPESTYLVLIPIVSLKELDSGPNEAAAMSPADLARFRKLNQETIVSSAYTLFAINPKMSNPPKAVIDADPGFWKP
ncbi:MAG TPA: hypothetical protein VMT15_04585 [Bryobacteraceae bacterium]|nr:hypothetical protein [Bryobacteraceae bacterium]